MTLRTFLKQALKIFPDLLNEEIHAAEVVFCYGPNEGEMVSGMDYGCMHCRAEMLKEAAQKADSDHKQHHDRIV